MTAQEVQNQGARQPPKPKLYVQRTKAKFNGATGAEKRKAVAAPTKSKVKLVRRPLGEGKAGEGGSQKLTRQKLKSEVDVLKRVKRAHPPGGQGGQGRCM